METKTFGDVIFKTESEGRFTARLCAWDTPDSVGDILRKGAFTASIARSLRKNRVLPVIYSHRWEDPNQHVGEIHPSNLRETDAGLEVSGTFYLTEPIAAKVFKQLERRALAEWSMGFSIQQAKPRATGGRDITQAHLIECGPCLKGLGDTETVSTKAASGTDLAPRRRQVAAVLRRPYEERLDLAVRQMRIERALHR